MILSSTFEEALVDAKRIHARQYRKGTGGVPYFSHLMAVASLVLEDGGTEREAQAALFHDAAEDQGGLATLGLIRERFSDEVAIIVAECSDTFERPKPPWRERKEKYIAHLETASEGALRVTAADKLHNVRCIVTDLRAGEDTWSRFSASPEETIWYYKMVAAKLVGRMPQSRNVRELCRAIIDMEDLYNEVEDR